MRKGEKLTPIITIVVYLQPEKWDGPMSLHDMLDFGELSDEVTEIYDIEPDKVICVGDNMNDLELLKEAAFSFCPKNGSEQLKKYADFIAPSNEEHIIKHIVQWLQYKLNTNNLSKFKG